MANIISIWVSLLAEADRRVHAEILFIDNSDMVLSSTSSDITKQALYSVSNLQYLIEES